MLKLGKEHALSLITKSKSEPFNFQSCFAVTMGTLDEFDPLQRFELK